MGKEHGGMNFQKARIDGIMGKLTCLATCAVGMMCMAASENAVVHPEATDGALINPDGSVAWCVTDNSFDFKSLEPKLKGVEKPRKVATPLRREVK